MKKQPSRYKVPVTGACSGLPASERPSSSVKSLQRTRGTAAFQTKRQGKKSRRKKTLPLPGGDANAREGI